MQASALPLGHFAEKGPLRTVRKCNGADNGARTRDPNLGKVVLYQLSHVRLRVINLRELSKRRKYFFQKSCPKQVHAGKSCQPKALSARFQCRAKQLHHPNACAGTIRATGNLHIIDEHAHKLDTASAFLGCHRFARPVDRIASASIKHLKHNTVSIGLQHVVIVDESNAPTNVVTIGCKVTVADKNGNTMPAYRIVGSQESDPMNGIISEESPFGKALVGAKEGDTVTVEAPSGAIVYTVQKIER